MNSEIDDSHESAPEPLVSVVLPVYNAESIVERALASIVDQSLRQLEIIVIDDGSRDKTAEIVRRWMPKCDLRLILQSKNAGPAAARNAGIAVARGKFIAFLDADDEWLPDKLQMQVRALEKTQGASLCACEEYWIYRDASVDVSGEGLAPENQGPHAWKSLLARAFIHTSSVMIPRTLARQLGGFDERLLVGEDQDFWIRLARAGELIWVPEPLVRVHNRAEGHMATNADREIECLLPMIERHVAQYRSELSDSERRAILRRRYGQIGRNLCDGGAWRTGAGLVLRAAAMGYSPLQHLLYVVRTAPLLRSLRRRKSFLHRAQD